MRKADVETLVDYMYWCNHRILDAAERLPVEELTAPSQLTTRNLRATLVHELDVEWSWRLNLQGRLSEDEGELEPEDYPDVASIREHWTRDEAEMRAWIAAMSDADVEAEVESGLSRNRRPLWEYVMHIVFHGSQQQADAASLTSLAGASPGDLGFLEYLKVKK
jgi:uncharacterized damage-inducible protein DinB